MLALAAAFSIVFPAFAAAAEDGGLSGLVTAPNGRGVANAEVRATREGRSHTRRTGADGRFSFSSLPTGRYSVSVDPPVGFKLAGDGARTVSVQDGRTAGGVNFTLAPIAEPTPTPAATPTAVPTLAPASLAQTNAGRDSAQAKPAASPTTTATRAALFATPVPPSPAPSPTAQGASGGTPVSSSAEAPLPTSPAASPVVANSVVSSGGGSIFAPALPVEPQAGVDSQSTDDILAGRGLHWQGGGIRANVAAEAAPTSETAAVAAAIPNPAARASQPRRVVTSFEALRATAGRLSAAQIRTWADASSFWLGVPFRTQIDGSEYAYVNCGPASLSMAMLAFGVQVDPPALRDYVNYLSGDYSPDDGTSLDVLSRVAREAGLSTFGLYSGGSYRRWTIETVREHIRAGQPVITLVKYRSLPGHGSSLAEFDHYIVITGLSGNDLIYNDAAFASEYGFNLLISPEDLERAWSYSSISNHAVAIGLGTGTRALDGVPSALTADSLALDPDPGRDTLEPPLGMLPGAAAQWLRERVLAERGAGAPDQTGGAGRDGSNHAGDAGSVLPKFAKASPVEAEPPPSGRGNVVTAPK